MSLRPKPVKQGAANLIGRFDAVWPVAVLDSRIILGPIIDLPEQVPSSRRDHRNMQCAEDAVEANVAQINEILQAPNTASYKRETQRGVVYAEFVGETHDIRKIGSKALTSAQQ